MDLFPWSPRSQMSPVDILSFYICEQSDVVEEERAERERSGGINYVRVTGTQHKAQQKPPSALFLSLSLCGPLFTPFAPDKIKRVSVINSLLSHCDCSSVMCVCVNVQSGATSLHTFNARMFEGTIEEEVRNEAEGTQRTRGEEEGRHKDESGEGNKGEEEMRELGHKAPKGKTTRSQKDLRNDCETISFLSCERTSEVIRTT